MAIEIFDCPQNSPEWYEARRGVPTASMFATIMASGRGGGPSLTRQKYLHTLAGEILTGEVVEGYTNASMERGKAMEEEARKHYAFVRDAEPQLVGFVRNGKCGASPDSLLSTDGALEIKTAIPSVLIPMLLKGEFPPEHRHQCQGVLMVTERQWIDLIVYWPKMKPLIVRAERDEELISEIRDAVDVFELELRRLIQRLR